ncbi:hypothetical protein IAR50_001798 [Cryptococcus sp. DSM 104548]
MTLTTLETLPSEVCRLIFEHLLTTTHKPTLVTLARVSRVLYALSIHRLYEKVRLNGSNAEPFFGCLIAGSQGGVDEIAAPKPYLSHYIRQFQKAKDFYPSSRFIPSLIAKNLWRLMCSFKMLLSQSSYSRL